MCVCVSRKLIKVHTLCLYLSLFLAFSSPHSNPYPHIYKCTHTPDHARIFNAYTESRKHTQFHNTLVVVVVSGGIACFISTMYRSRDRSVSRLFRLIGGTGLSTQPAPYSTQHTTTSQQLIGDVVALVIDVV